MDNPFIQVYELVSQIKFTVMSNTRQYEDEYHEKKHKTWHINDTSGGYSDGSKQMN